jgi:hypothetical protein
MENQEQVQEVKQLGAYQLAQLAGVSDPDSQESKGALFLKSIRDMLVEMYIEGDLTEITFNEIIGGAPSIYFSDVIEEYNNDELLKLLALEIRYQNHAYLSRIILIG